MRIRGIRRHALTWSADNREWICATTPFHFAGHLASPIFLFCALLFWPPRLGIPAAASLKWESAAGPESSTNPILSVELKLVATLNVRLLGFGEEGYPVYDLTGGPDAESLRMQAEKCVTRPSFSHLPAGEPVYWEGVIVHLTQEGKAAAEGKLQKLFGERASIRRSALSPTVVVDTGGGISPEEISSILANLRPRYLEPNYRVRHYYSAPPPPPPGSPLNDWSWDHVNGISGRINLTPLVPTSPTHNRPVLAVIDNGIDYSSPMLRPFVYVNRREIAWNCLDDDGNGFVDDWMGYDFLENDPDPINQGPCVECDGKLEHGTRTAIIFSELVRRTNPGLTGSQQIQTLNVRAFDCGYGFNDVNSVSEALYYAVDSGAKVVLACWGLKDKARALEEATLYAESRGVLMVVALPNEQGFRTLELQREEYPLCFEVGNVIGVIAHDSSGDIYNCAAIHPVYAHIAAPGVNLPFACGGTGSVLEYGNSFAAAHVAAAAALIWSLPPSGDLPRTPAEMIRLLTAKGCPSDKLRGACSSSAELSLRFLLGESCPPSQEN